jgi:outer membrane protein OmpA-like peptidoglycan-associated protein
MIRLVLLVACAACGSPTPPPMSGRQVSSVAPARVPLAIAGKERIHFASNDARLSAAEHAVLESVVQRLRAEPVLSLQISGHADANELDPDKLGQLRATAVRRHLLAQGIAEVRLLLRTAGAAEPRDTNATEAGRASNRRVEFERATIKVDPFGGRVVITDADVEILDPVTFLPGSVKFTPSSIPALDAVAATLHGNPSIQLVEVQSHTDERGDDAENLRLTQARAKVVVTYLISKGIDPARLDAQGYGETQPLDRGHDQAAWAKNRRIAFVIVKRTP